MTEPTKEQLEKWEMEATQFFNEVIELDAKHIGISKNELIKEEDIEQLKCWSNQGYLAAKKSDFEEIEKLKQLKESDVEDNHALDFQLITIENEEFRKEIESLKEQLKEAKGILESFHEYREATDRKETSKSNTKWHTYERILYDSTKIFLEKQDKENKDEK